jgi:hypothetical protein
MCANDGGVGIRNVREGVVDEHINVLDNSTSAAWKFTGICRMSTYQLCARGYRNVLDNSYWLYGSLRESVG